MVHYTCFFTILWF